MTDPTPPINPLSTAETHRERTPMSLTERLLAPSNRLTWIAALALMIALLLWVSFTPAGILGKADAVGYAVCHRIEVRSFLFPEGRQLPMCARCTGTFIGVVVGLVAPALLFKRRRAGNFPSVPIMALMLAFSAFWAFDGANSFTFLIPWKLPHLYEPSNFLRLTSGMMHGISMGSLLLPVANATLWADVTPERTITTIWQYLIMLAIGVVLILMVLSGLGIFLYPLGLLSAIGAMSILAMICTVMMATILGYENRARSFTEALPLIMFGFAITISLIGIIDAGRFAMFGTWGGMEF